jgi:hypothetical protein
MVLCHKITAALGELYTGQNGIVAFCHATIQMGRTWVGDVPTMFYKIRNYLDHPHVSRF